MRTLVLVGAITLAGCGIAVENRQYTAAKRYCEGFGGVSWVESNFWTYDTVKVHCNSGQTVEGKSDPRGDK